MKQLDIYIGMDFTKDGKPRTVESAAHARVIVKRLADMITDITGGCTVTDARGSYTDDNGAVIVESSKHLMTLAEDSNNNLDRIRSIIALTREALDQESILVTIRDVCAEFI